MNPRDLIYRAATPRTAGAMLLACALLLSIAIPHTARAEVQSVVVRPTILTACDSISVRVEGVIESTCRSFAMATISGPVPIPEWAGPVPAYRYTVTVTVDEFADYGQPCGPANTPYAKEFRVGSLPPGQHFVTAIERVRDSITLAPLPDTSTASTSFTVAPSDTCWTSCTLLSFGSIDPSPEEPRCVARAQPGGEGCFEVRLMNSEPVAGAQLEIRILVVDLSFPPASFTAKSVRTTGRADSLDVLWEPDGNGVKVILFSPSGKTIAPGHGPILHLCFDVGATTSGGAYFITFQKTLVANADGDELPQCPQFRLPSSLFCVGLDASTCDLDGDGVSNVRDIIRLARCALAGDSCPDTIAARADCDGNGGVDVRDVICCARTLLARGAWSDSWTGDNPTSQRPTVLGFAGESAWESETSGSATIEVRPGDAFGGVQFSVIPPSGVRITSLDLGSNQGGYQLAWHRGNTGRIFAMLYRIADSAPGADPVPINLRFEPESWASPATAWGTLRLVTPLAATWEGGRASSEIQNGEADLPATAPAALRISRARPNPFAASTEIEFAIGAAGMVSVRVYDVAGRLVRSMIHQSMPSGVHRISWDGRDGRGRSAPAGFYFVRIGSAGAEKTARILKMR